MTGVQTCAFRSSHLELGGGNGSPLDVCGTLVLPLGWRRVCGELLELQKGCEGPFGPGAVEPGGLPSVGLHRVGHD